MHTPVLLGEVVELLAIRGDGLYVDGTLGLAGHALAIASRLTTGRLLGLDVDPVNLAAAENRLQPLGEKTITRQVNFRGLHGVLRDVGWSEVDGMLFDLGIASSQLDRAEMGLSFSKEAPLDMRLDPTSSMTAREWIWRSDEGQIAAQLMRFGETRKAGLLARKFKEAAGLGQLETTADLASLCEAVLGRWGKTHPATRSFLAIRAAVNREMENLDELLSAAPGHLKVGGRMLVITFHSLEDKVVKERFRELAQNGADGKAYRLVTRKPVEPTDAETRSNPRARSAKLRALERTA